MNHRTLLKRLLCLVLVVLLAAAAMTLTGCKKNPKPAEADAQATDVGAGEKLIYLTVTFKDESTRSYAVHTDADTVGEALLGAELIAGEDSQYGLYVTTVDGQTLDWDADGMYWAFYENGEYAASGVDSTAVTDGSTYAFVATSS